MSNNISIEHTVVILNGHRVEGWAPEGDALEFPNIEISNTEVGPDGKLLASGTGMRGGEMTFRLQANSRSFAFLAKQAVRIKSGASVTFDGSITNTQTGVTTEMRNGTLTSFPAGISLGNSTPSSREFVIYFEEITTNYDAATFTGIPAIVEDLAEAIG